ncbi:hypothetical protein HK098_008001, partial [Nowakowskiella sp. JEL0407]
MNPSFAIEEYKVKEPSTPGNVDILVVVRLSGLDKKRLRSYGIKDGHLHNLMRAIEKLKLSSTEVQHTLPDPVKTVPSLNATSPAPATTTNFSHQTPEKPKYDVMLSYNWAHQTEVKRIREALGSHGFSVWIDVEQMEGYTYESMMNAILS